jgi:hypothetical protein
MEYLVNIIVKIYLTNNDNAIIFLYSIKIINIINIYNS